MRFEPMIYPVGADGMRVEDPETGDPFEGNELGWIDPRALDPDGNQLSEMGNTRGSWRGLSASIENSTATPASTSRARKGGIIKREYWQDYLVPATNKFPDFDFVLVSVDTP
jgi:hypothetical protein